MVMAQHTNTQYVAHEFVKQYYTMLHKDPSQLHRFYTKESCLTHGGSPNAKSEEPVCGQEAIYEKIAQLNFHNCYAKIRSVDSHPTIGGGVVIQVNGELSNSGLVMRKFMQTFVLAQQEPKKYHVLNDIFRYQDETFEDTENEETVDGTVESENGYQTYESVPVPQMDPIPDEQEVPIMENKLQQENNIDKEYPYSATQQQDDDNCVIVNGGDMHEKIDGGEQDDEEKVNGFIRNDETLLQEVETYNGGEISQLEPSELEDNGEQPKVEDDGQLEDYDISTNSVEEIVETIKSIQEPQQPEGPPKPFTWAALAKKNTPVSQLSPAPVTKPPPKKASPTVQRASKKREEVTIQPAQPSKKEQPAVVEESRKRNPDNHQIFIGNLPSNVTEKDVREAFSEFGSIVEIRLNPKNFGFIAFDGPDAPMKILNKTKTIVINNNTINTEVKRSVSGGSGRGMGGGGGGGFRRGEKEGRGGGGGGDRRSENKNRNSGQNRSGKNSFGQPKQRNSEDGKTTDNKNKESRGSRDQRTSRR